MYLDSYDYDEYYGTTLAEDRKKLMEDIGHLYFIGVGVLMTSISDPFAALLAAVATVFVRDWMRRAERRVRK